ncbi:MAG: polyisoprenoid-binding protein [Planctomycetota bacterium]|nr:MAG: polyisoprenoid-binding protein [Planctomycetota bacterium]
MRLCLTLAALGLAAGGIAFLSSSAPVAPAVATAADKYEIDAVHSSVLFRASHMGISHTWGRFDKFSGTLSYDAKDPAACSVRLEVESASVNTGDAGRDGHLGNNDFFNAKQFPKITFASTKVSAAGEGKLKVVGDLELLGVKKPVTLEITKVGEGDFPMDGSHRIGFDTSFTIDRTEYGMKYATKPGTPDPVLLTISLEGIRK